MLVEQVVKQSLTCARTRSHVLILNTLPNLKQHLRWMATTVRTSHLLRFVNANETIFESLQKFEGI